MRSTSASAILLLAGIALAQSPDPTKVRISTEELAGAVQNGVGALLAREEGEGRGEWPYEGVYRVQGKIPIGYRVGNTGICIMALLQAPGYADDADRQAAVLRGVNFICTGIDQPLMSEEKYEGGYDVRGWGYIFGMQGLVRAVQANAIPEHDLPKVRSVIEWYVKGLKGIEIPKAGGWNYARSAGRDKPSAPSSFMTGCALQALFEAQETGFDVDAEVIDRAIAFLEKSKGATGAVQYAGTSDDGRDDQTPGAVGRMLVVETTLRMAGRGSVSAVRGALDAFIVHWDWLDQRRAKTGTHVPPYMVAPYYFMFAHRYAAQAIEMLPGPERAEYRRRVNNLLFSVRSEDGTWNDRVFPRTANYGTALAMMSMMEPTTGHLASWAPRKQPDESR
jgi:hypothetical protein